MQLSDNVKTFFKISTAITLSLGWMLVFIFSFSTVSNFFSKGLNLSIISPYKTDVSSIHLASQIMKPSEGNNFYNYQFQKQKFHELFTTNSNNAEKEVITEHFYYYPPNSLIIPWLLQEFSPKQIFQSINILSFALLMLSMIFAFKSFGRSQIVFLFAASILFFQPFLHNVMHAQLSLLIGSCFYLYYYFSNNNKKVVAGLFLAITFFKPQLGLALLLVPILTKDWKPVIVSLIFTFVLLLFGFSIIGIEGYESYLKLIIQYLGLQNYGLYFPQPIEPAYPIDDLVTSTFSNNSICNLSLGAVIKSLNVIFSVSVVGFMGWLSKVKINNESKNSLLFALISLCSLFVFKYHQVHDYCLWIFICMIAVMNCPKLMKKALLWFVGCSLFIFLVTSLIGSQSLVLDYHIHLYPMIMIVSIVVMIKELLSHGKERNYN